MRIQICRNAESLIVTLDFLFLHDSFDTFPLIAVDNDHLMIIVIIQAIWIQFKAVYLICTEASLLIINPQQECRSPELKLHLIAKMVIYNTQSVFPLRDLSFSKEAYAQKDKA